MEDLRLNRGTLDSNWNKHKEIKNTSNSNYIKIKEITNMFLFASLFFSNLKDKETKDQERKGNNYKTMLTGLSV